MLITRADLAELGDDYYAMLMVMQEFAYDAKDYLADFISETLDDGSSLWDTDAWTVAWLVQKHYPGAASGFIADVTMELA